MDKEQDIEAVELLGYMLLILLMLVMMLILLLTTQNL